MKLLASTVVALVLVAGCGPDPVVLPTPPMQTEMDALVAAYESPTGTFDTAKAEDTVMRAQARLEELQLDWLPDLMSKCSARVDSRLDQSGLSDDPATLTDTDRIARSSTLTRPYTASARDGTTPQDTRRGEQRLDRHHGNRRRRVPQSRRLGHGDQLPRAHAPIGNVGIDGFLEGTVILHLEGALSQDVSQARFLFYLTGSMGVASKMASGSFDFRSTRAKSSTGCSSPTAETSS